MPSHSDTDTDTGTGSRAIYDVYCTQNSPLGERTSIPVQAALLSKFPSHSLISTTCDLIAYAEAGHAIATPNEGVHPTLRSWGFQPAARGALNGTPGGQLTQEVLFGQFDYVWQDQKFRVFVVDNGPCDRRCYVLSPPAMTGEREEEEGGKDQVVGSKKAESLVLSANIWSESSHKKVWVYDYGRWSKDKNLWEIIHSASWEDLVLDEGTKRSILRDVEGFFDAKETYTELRAPWKRGLIFHGSPGNGKTTMTKLLMKTLMIRSEPVPTLVVKTLAQRVFGPEMSLRQIFVKARQLAPCLLLFEDLDSLVTNEVRSYFFNEVDGLENNDGILMIGSTNHYKLDHGLSKRPSRFDRKYLFGNPSLEDRVQYFEFWRQKLSGRPGVEIPSTLPDHIASITDGFSFAYLKEALFASLLTLAKSFAEEKTATEQKKEEEEDRKWGRFGSILQQQVAILRQDILQ